MPRQRDAAHLAVGQDDEKQRDAAPNNENRKPQRVLTTDGRGLTQILKTAKTRRPPREDDLITKASGVFTLLISGGMTLS